MKLYSFEGDIIVNWLLLAAFSSVVLSTLTHILPETILYIICFVILSMVNYRTLLNGTVLYFLFFQTIVLIDCTGGNGLMPFNNALIYIMSLLIPVMASDYYGHYSLINWTKVANILLLMVTFSCVTTFFINLTQPNALRTIMSAQNSGNEMLQTRYSLLGMITYIEGYAIPLLFPLLVFWFKVTRKYIILFNVILLLYVLFSSALTTAFFIGLLSVIISLFYNAKKGKIYNLMIIAGLVLLITIGNYIFTQGFLSFLSSYSNEIMYEKIGDINITLQGGEGMQVKNRQYLYSLSWNSFYKNPLMGNWNKSLIGGHSFFADYLSYYGLVVFSIFIIFLYKQIMKPLMYIREEVKPYYFFSLIPFIGMGFLKGAPAHLTFLFLFIITPGLAIYISQLLDIKEGENAN